MQEERSFVYTLILGICMLLSLLMIGRMLLGHPAGTSATPQEQSGQPKGESDMEIRLDEKDLMTLIEAALPFPADEMQVEIGEDSTVGVRAKVRKQSIEQSGLVSGNMRTALLFLPEECMVYGKWETAMQDGMLALRCLRAELAGFSLPGEAAATFSQYLADAINGRLRELGIKLAGISCADGVLSLHTS